MEFRHARKQVLATLSWRLVLLALWCLVTGGGTVDASEGAMKQGSVQIWNRMKEGNAVGFQCHSGDGFVVLPLQVLYPNETYSFNVQYFVPSGNYYPCTFQVGDEYHILPITRHQEFNLWDNTPGSKIPVDCTHCFWDIGEDGFFVRDNYAKKYIFYLRWITFEKALVGDQESKL